MEAPPICRPEREDRVVMTEKRDPVLARALEPRVHIVAPSLDGDELRVEAEPGQGLRQLGSEQVHLCDLHGRAVDVDPPLEIGKQPVKVGCCRGCDAPRLREGEIVSHRREASSGFRSCATPARDGVDSRVAPGGGRYG